MYGRDLYSLHVCLWAGRCLSWYCVTLCKNVFGFVCVLVEIKTEVNVNIIRT